MRTSPLIHFRTKVDTHTILRQLASMIQAGIPLIRSLEILEKSQQTLPARSMLHQVKLQLHAGHPLHECLRHHPDWFDTFTCRLVQLGEQTGKLADVLDTLALHHEKRAALLRSIRQALFYPTMLLISSIALTTCMFIFVVPAFSNLFNDMDKPLPLITRCIFAISRIISTALPFILLIIISLITITRFRKKTIRAFLRSWLDLLPVVTRQRRALAFIHFCKHLALSLSAGMPILTALQFSTGQDHPHAIASAIRQIRAALMAGSTLHSAMQLQNIFPELILQMVKTGEESGTLEFMLNKSADLMETELNARIIQLTRLLEPLIMAVLGVLIGGLVIGMYLPVFNLGSVL